MWLDVVRAARLAARAEIGPDVDEVDIPHDGVGIAPAGAEQLGAVGGLQVDDGVRAAGEQLAGPGETGGAVDRGGRGGHRSHLRRHRADSRHADGGQGLVLVGGRGAAHAERADDRAVVDDR